MPDLKVMGIVVVVIVLILFLVWGFGGVIQYPTISIATFHLSLWDRVGLVGSAIGIIALFVGRLLL